MAEKPKEPKDHKRLNRAVSAGEALSRVLDPALKKRGFASRDLITHWAVVAPAPYDKVALPDRLSWPRGSRGAEGATLYLRCAPSQTLALAYDGQTIAAAINRYFGYVLIGAVRLSLEPFVPAQPEEPAPSIVPSPATRARVAEAVGGVADPGVKSALERLGERLAHRN